MRDDSPGLVTPAAPAAVSRPARPRPPPSLLSAASRAPSTAPPLSHHDILALVEPFSHAGLRLDLPASDRLARRLVFKPASLLPHAALQDAPPPGVQVHYLLDLADAQHPELTRHLSGPSAAQDGLTARLQVRGGGLAELLACARAVPPQRQWHMHKNARTHTQATLALSHRIDLPRARSPGTTAPGLPPALVLTEALAHVGGCRLHMRVPRVGGMPAELELRPVGSTAGAAAPVLMPARPARPAHSAPVTPEPPADLLAVLGLRWSRLSRVRGAWRSTVQLTRREPGRSADAQARLLQAVDHLAQTLAAPPAQFHQRFGRARWAVTLRRATPLTVALGLIAAAALVPVLDLGEGSVLRMLIFNAPPLLMVWMFALREFPRIELPPLPRVPQADAWAALVAAAPAVPQTSSPEARA